MILLGNKLDKEDKRIISKKKGKELADEYGIKFFETSNKTGVNVREAAMALFYEIVKIEENEENEIKRMKILNKYLSF